MTNYSLTRLEKRTRKQQLQQTVLWLLLTIALIGALLYWGVPLFIKFAGWYGDWRSGETPTLPDDTVPPAPPRLILSYTATNSAQLQLQGFTEPGASVEVFINDQQVKALSADNSGQFLASDITLEKGFNYIYATAIDQTNNKSAPSKKELVTFDDQAPELTLESPHEGDKFYGSTQQRLTVKGSAEPQAQVIINSRSVIVDQLGKFSLPYTLQEGEQTLTIIAKDEAGNETKKEIKVTFAL